MKKEEVVSTGVMTIVSVLVLIGFTVAWYSADLGRPTVLGMRMLAAEMGSIKIALTSGGEDISVLAENDIEGDEYADIGMEKLTNIENGKLAPGAFGKVTFYVTPTEEGIEYCDIVPSVEITQDGVTWYSGKQYAEERDSAEEGESANDSTITLARLYEITQEHVEFFAVDGTKIDEAMPLHLTWSEDESKNKAEKVVEFYWKWHYEYPFTEAENRELDEDAKQQKIYEYDVEDTMIGNNITSMKFHFTFTAN